MKEIKYQKNQPSWIIILFFFLFYLVINSSVFNFFYDSYKIGFFDIKHRTNIIPLLYLSIGFILFTQIFIKILRNKLSSAKFIIIREDGLLFNENRIKFDNIRKIFYGYPKVKFFKVFQIYCIENTKLKKYKEAISDYENNLDFIERMKHVCEVRRIEFIERKKVNFKLMFSLILFILILIYILGNFLTNESIEITKFEGLNPFTGEKTEIIVKNTLYEDKSTETHAELIKTPDGFKVIMFKHWNIEGFLLGDSFKYENGILYRWVLNDPDDPSKGGEWILGKLS